MIDNRYALHTASRGSRPAHPEAHEIPNGGLRVRIPPSSRTMGGCRPVQRAENKCNLKDTPAMPPKH
ncbi:MAG: hypothetical protein KDJ28_18830, partial [Candidatus Competibacteraceae bacterium]|nr:hypothetical protein [Candidatus Competibacteraceae bacterium]